MERRIWRQEALRNEELAAAQERAQAWGEIAQTWACELPRGKRVEALVLYGLGRGALACGGAVWWTTCEGLDDLLRQVGA